MDFKPMFPGHLERCYFCANAWGGCTCKFQDPADEVGDPTDAPGFDFNEFFISDPSMSVCGRFFVDPNVYYGDAYVKCTLGDAWTHWPVDPKLTNPVQDQQQMGYNRIMNNTQIIGYRVKTPSGAFVNSYGTACGPGTQTFETPEPCSASEAYRRISVYLEHNPNAAVPTVEPVTRQLTPIETAANELGGLLESLMRRHNVQLGMDREQINKRIAKELVDFGASGIGKTVMGLIGRQ